MTFRGLFVRMWQLLITLVFAVKRLLSRNLGQAVDVVSRVMTLAEVSVRAIVEVPATGWLAAGRCPRRLMAEDSDRVSKTIHCGRCQTVLRQRRLPDHNLQFGPQSAMSLGRLLPAFAA